MADRWLYTTDGKPAFYQNGKYLYSAYKNQCEYYADDENKYFYPMDGGGPAFFVNNNWLYTMSGEASFYYG
jgi:hypothetical protein